MISIVSLQAYTYPEPTQLLNFTLEIKKTLGQIEMLVSNLFFFPIFVSYNWQLSVGIFGQTFYDEMFVQISWKWNVRYLVKYYYQAL